MRFINWQHRFPVFKPVRLHSAKIHNTVIHVGSRLPVTRYKPFIIFNRYSMLLGICNITPFIGSSKFPSVSQLTNRKLVFFMDVGDGLWLTRDGTIYSIQENV
jgi:hypothetical protein